jgi:hypothetical protein
MRGFRWFSIGTVICTPQRKDENCSRISVLVDLKGRAHDSGNRRRDDAVRRYRLDVRTAAARTEVVARERAQARSRRAAAPSPVGRLGLRRFEDPWI